MRLPNASLLDPGFRYIPACETDVAATFKRFGFDPRANERRRERLRSRPSSPPHAVWGALSLPTNALTSLSMKANSTSIA